MSYNFTETDQWMLKTMRKEGVIKVGELTQLKDGSWSPVYMDMREKLTDDNPGLLEKVGRLFCEKIWKVTENAGKHQCLIGVPDAAHALACATSLASLEDPSKPTLSFIIQRKAAKEYGTITGSRMIGTPKPDTEYNLVDDVITTGGSTFSAIEAAEAVGAEVVKVLALLDRQQGGSAELKKRGYDFVALLKADEKGEVSLA